jgi:ABC-type branched-subunit amino acid transport system substrate-binding protein
VAGYDEVSDLFDAAKESEYLFRSSLGYFGGDGSAQADSIVGNGDAADFASQSGFPSPLLTVSADSASQAMAVTTAIGGDEPNAFALAAYDATILLQQIFTKNNRVLPIGNALLDSFVSVAQGYHGASGIITLNDDCDRASGSYAFWGVCEVDDDYSWMRVGEWNPATDPTAPGSVRYLGCP